MRISRWGGILSLAVLGALGAGGCATTQSLGPAALHHPTRVDFLAKVSQQLDHLEQQVDAIQARLDPLEGETRARLADQLAAVRVSLLGAHRDLRTLRSAADAAHWKTDRTRLQGDLDQMSRSITSLMQAVKKA